MNDGVLLRRYSEDRDEVAFRQVTERHLGLVYATALRRAGTPESAREIAQAVFILLARKASQLWKHDNLAGWLHRAAWLKAREHLRAERRRRFHEMEAAMMNEQSCASQAEPWNELSQSIDEHIEALPRHDRDLVLWRFYNRLSWQAIAERLGTSEDAARMRLKRVLEKLRGKLQTTVAGITTHALADWLESYAAPASVPAGLLEEIQTAVATFSPPAPPAAGWLASVKAPAAALSLGVASLVVLLMALWPKEAHLSSIEETATAAPTNGGESALMRSSEMVAASSEAAPTDSVTPENAVLLDELRRILRSEVEDGARPPDDLRRILESLNGAPEAAFELLRETVFDPVAPKAARSRALWGFWLLGEAHSDFVVEISEICVAIFSDPAESALWWDASEILRHLGLPAESVPLMVEALWRNPAAGENSFHYLSAAAVRHPDAVLPSLRLWLHRDDPLKRVAAAVLAGVPGENPDPLIPILLTGVDGHHSHISLQALEKLGPAAASASPALRQIMRGSGENRTPWWRESYAKVLAAIEPESRAEFPEVEAFLRRKERAAEAEKRVETARSDLEKLIARLGNPDRAWDAALDLAEMKQAAAGALPALREALNDPALAEAQTYIAKAIKAIDPESPQPFYHRDDLIGALRAVNAVLTSLPEQPAEHDLQELKSWLQHLSTASPETLAETAAKLDRINPQLREAFVSNLIARDPALRTVLRATE